MKTPYRRIALVGFTVILGGYVAAAAVDGGRSPGARHASVPHPGIDTFSAAVSVGEEIATASTIVRGVVVSVGEETWNSPDGRDWSEEWEKSPREFKTVPAPVTPVGIQIEQLLKAPDDKPPAAVEGSVIEATFLGRSFEKGQEMIFFLVWSPMYLSDGSSRMIWLGDEAQGSWYYRDGLAWPADQLQLYSIRTAVDRGLVEAVLDKDGSVRGIPLSSLIALISQEDVTKAADVASFEQWPWEPAARLDAENDDLPDELVSPSAAISEAEST